MDNLYLINLHIGRGTSTEMPEPLAGALVSAFVTAPNHEFAARQVVSNITGRGFTFIDIQDGKIHQLDPHKWDTYVQETWPEFSIFPNQEQVLAGLSSGLLFFGPFCGYEQERA